MMMSVTLTSMSVNFRTRFSWSIGPPSRRLSMMKANPRSICTRDCPESGFRETVPMLESSGSDLTKSPNVLIRRPFDCAVMLALRRDVNSIEKVLENPSLIVIMLFSNCREMLYGRRKS